MPSLSGVKPVGDGVPSTVEGTEINVKLINDTPKAIGLKWVGFDGRLKVYGTIKPQETWPQSTFTSHPWVLSDGEVGEELRRVLFTAAGEIKLSELL
jgi:hypothetical protein